jgi:hypothetical protein
MNDDTYEEVVTFKLSRFSVYVALSSIFVLLVGVTVALIVFTPVKYYIPGYGSAKVDREYRQLKYITDSLEKQVALQTRYVNSIRKVFAGDAEVQLDTTSIQLPKDEVND